MTRAMLLAIVFAMLGCGAATPAAAASISYDVIFSASDFSPGLSPSTPVLGEVRLTLDPTKKVVDQKSISLSFFSRALDSSALTFNYTPLSDPQDPDFLQIGGGGDGAGVIGSGLPHDFLLNIVGLVQGDPTFLTMTYLADSKTFISLNGIVHATQVSATPIPAALPLFAAALGALGFAGWRRRTVA